MPVSILLLIVTVSDFCGNGVIYPQRRCDDVYLEAYCKCPVGFTGKRCELSKLFSV